ncbi:MAG: hypothetical protein KDC41_18205, partial [Saprospiraceae bacterium]|nr:hypothetical protein [Saprospiraceae bacterium]
MNRPTTVLLFACTLFSCSPSDGNQEKNDQTPPDLGQEVVNETLRSWQAYQTYAWGSDVLMPLSKDA